MARKKTIAPAAKVETKVEAPVKEAEVKVEVEAVKAEPVKEEKAEAKKATKKAAAKTETVKKETVKKETTKKETTKKSVEPAVVVQFGGQEVDMATVIENAKKAFEAEGNKVSSIKEIQIYVKPEEYAAYYVINGVSGKINLF